MDKFEELESKVKELEIEIEKLKEKKDNKPWKPKYGVQYWYVNHSDGVLSAYWYGNAVDKMRYDLGNIFSTRKGAEFYKEQLKVEAVLKQFARPFVVDKGNFMLRYDHYRNEILIEDFGFIQFSNIYFPSKEIAQKAIDTVGEERIKKYYFEVIN